MDNNFVNCCAVGLAWAEGAHRQAGKFSIDGAVRICGDGSQPSMRRPSPSESCDERSRPLERCPAYCCFWVDPATGACSNIFVSGVLGFLVG
jgi:hypothetical protein